MSKVKRIVIPVVAVIAAGLVFLLMNGCYLMKQGTYLVSYNMKARPISAIVENPVTPTDTRVFLERVESIQNFAEQELGLKRGKNYRKFVDIGKSYLADIVSASKKTSFDQYLWKFPFFGSFPYKGFFTREDAEKEAERLSEKNLDVMIRKVDAFSTLGFFSDPVFSFMTGYSPYAIANLIIHENTHATIFLKNNISFNEQLATFIGDEGALLYIRNEFGEESEEYLRTLDSIRDQNTFIDYLRSMYKALNGVYISALSEEEKLTKKNEIILKYQTEFAETYDERFLSENYKRFASMKINNAYLAAYATYTADLDMFYAFYASRKSDLRNTIRDLLEVKKWKGDPYDFLRAGSRD